jgi:hypothetical protein
MAGICWPKTARQRLHGARQQQPLDVDADARAGGSRVGHHLAQHGFDLHRIFFRDHAAVELEGDLAGHHVAVGVQRNGLAFAVAAAHDQVGDRFEATGLHLGGWYRVFFSFKAKGLQQLGGALGMRGVVAGRCVGGHANQFLQKAHFLVEMGIDQASSLS